MADTLIWTPEEASALEQSENERLDKQANLELIEAQEATNQEKAAEESLLKGEIVEPEPVISYAEKMEKGRKSIDESFERLVTGKENWLDPYRESREISNVPYADPYKMFTQTLGAVFRVFGDFSIPEEEWYIDNPREALRQRLSRPLKDEQGLPDIDAVLSSNIPRPMANDIILKTMSKKYNIPLDKLKTLSAWRLGTSQDDNFITRGMKSFAQLIDNVMFRLPSAISLKGRQAVEQQDFDNLLIRPKGQDYFDSDTVNMKIKPLIPAIRRGEIDEININGQVIDVDANDTLDTIQNRGYKDFMQNILAMAQNVGMESRADVGSMVAPVSGSARAIFKTAAKTATMARLTKTAAALEKVSKPTGTNFFSKSGTAIVNIGPIRQAMPELAARMEQSAAAQVGDYLITQLAVQPTLAALGAPAGQEGTMAAMSAVMTVPLTAIGLPGTIAQHIETTNKLQNNVPLMKAMLRTENFKDMPRILQTKLRQYEGPNAENVFNQFKRIGALTDEVRGSLTEQLADMPNYTLEWARHQSKLPEVRKHIDRLMLDVGFDHTITGKETVKILTEMINENTAKLKQEELSANAGETQKKAMAKRVNFFNKTLAAYMQNTELMNNPELLVADMMKRKHPLANNLQKRLQNIETDIGYERALFNMAAAGGLYDSKSMAYALSVYNGGVFAKTDPILAEIYELVQRDLSTTRGEPSLHGKQTLKNLMDNPDNVRDFLYAVETERAKLQELKDAPSRYRQKTKEISEKTAILRKELVNVNREVKALSSQNEAMRRDYGKAKNKMQAAMDTIDTSVPIGFAKSPEFQISKSMLDNAIQMDLPIDDAIISQLQKLVDTAEGGNTTLQNLVKSMYEYNSMNKESKRFKDRYDLAVSSFLEIQDAIQNTESSVEYKFAHVLRGLVSKEAGTPEGMYHGTAAQIQGFHPEYFHGRQLYGEGFYTTDDFATAQSYKSKNYTRASQLDRPPQDVVDAFTTADGGTYQVDHFSGNTLRSEGEGPNTPSRTVYVRNNPSDLINNSGIPAGGAVFAGLDGQGRVQLYTYAYGKKQPINIGDSLPITLNPVEGLYPIQIGRYDAHPSLNGYKVAHVGEAITAVNRKTIPGATRDYPKVYKVIEKQPIRFVDLEVPATADVAEVLRKRADISAKPMKANDFENAYKLLAANPDTPLKDLFQAIPYEPRETLIGDLKQLGYGGISHVGGLITGGPRHNVKIYWEPWNQIDIVPYSEAKLKVTPAHPIDAFGAIQAFLYNENPKFAKILDSVPEFADLINQAAELISQGEAIPPEMRNMIRTFATDRNEARRILRALGEARDSSEKVQDMLHDMSKIESVLTTAEDVIVFGKQSFDDAVDLIKQRKENLTEALPRMRDLRKQYNSVEFMKELKKLDEQEVYPVFDKIAEGIYPNANERKLAYQYLTGTIGQQIYLRNHPAFMITNRQKAEAMFQALQIHSAAAIDTLRKNFNETFGKAMNMPAFISLFINPSSTYNGNGDIQHILSLAAIRRNQGAFRKMVATHLVNQEVGLDWVQDRVGLDVESDFADLVFLQQEGSQYGRNWVVNELQPRLGKIASEGLTYRAIAGKKNFVEILKKLTGSDGMPDHIITASPDGTPALTPYGEIIYAWKVTHNGKSLDFVMRSLFGNDWASEPSRPLMVERAKQYWVDPDKIGRREWDIGFKFLHEAKKFDYDRLQAVNDRIEFMNKRNGTSYPLYQFYPNRISVGIDTGAFQRIIHNTEVIDTTSYDILFGRDIGTSNAGQLKKLDGLDIRKTKHPESVLMDDTYKLFETAYSQHTKRRIERHLTRIQDMGYYLDATTLLSHYKGGQSDTTILQRAVPREIANALIQVRGFGDLILLSRPMFNIGPMLGKFTSIVKNAAQMGQTAGENAINRSNRWMALRLLTSPITGIIRATGFGGFLTKVIDDPILKPAFLRMEPGAKWSYIEAGEGLTQRMYQQYQIALGTSSYRANETVERLTNRERNATQLNKSRTYDALPNFPGSGPYKKFLVSWNTGWDAAYDFTINLTKEAVEVNGAREAYISGMHLYEQAMIVAQRTQDPVATMEVLIAPMAGLRNEAPYYSIAQRLVNATKEGKLDFDYLFGSDLPEKYAIMYRNFVISRFDHHAAPPFIKNLMRVFPKSGQFFSAQFNGMYRLLNASRKFSSMPYTHKAAAMMYLASSMSMVAMWDTVKQQTGLDVSKWGVQPQAQAIWGALSGSEENLVELMKQAGESQTDLYGAEFSIMRQAFVDLAVAAFYARDDDTVENAVKMRSHAIKAIDSLAKLTIYGLIADIFSSPVGTASIFMSDHLASLLADARHSSKEGPMQMEDRQITFAVDLMETLYGEGWKEQSANPYWYETSDAVMTLLSEHNLSPVLDYWKKMRRYDLQRKKEIESGKYKGTPFNKYSMQRAWLEYLKQQAGKSYGREMKSVEPEVVEPTESSSPE